MNFIGYYLPSKKRKLLVHKAKDTGFIQYFTEKLVCDQLSSSNI